MSDPPDAVTARIYAGRRPVSDPAALDYLLPAEVGSRIFRQRIVPQLLAGPEPQEQPTVVFLVGQHGAGKSRTAAMVADALRGRGGFADLDSDLYKPHHPRYDELMTRDDQLMAAYLGPDSWAWLAQAHEYVRARKINALKPETGQDSRGAAAHMRAYRAAGFRVEVMVLAVPAAMSNQGIVSRHHEQVMDRGHGRLTVQANADRAYTGILDLADVIDRERLAHEVGVFRRGEATSRYGNALNARGQWQATPALRTAIQAERERSWTPAETADFQRAHARLRRELGTQWTRRLDEILLQAQPFMSQPARPASQIAVTRPDAGEEVRLAIEAARAASIAAAVRQARQQRQAAEADEADRGQVACWQATAVPQQRGRTEMDPEAETEPEAGR